MDGKQVGLATRQPISSIQRVKSAYLSWLDFMFLVTPAVRPLQDAQLVILVFLANFVLVPLLA